MNVANVITETILGIVRQRLPAFAEVRLEQQLVRDLALGSLDLAELAAMLETKLDRALFDDVAINGFLTVGELVEFCETSSAPSEA